ncbi:MAG TPA: lipocalin-like domain-containing protein, partial [Chthoniobacterales bacterium]|nr:lipocalin-like domain-containing protein [Chthoniobacterales bacterium]
MLRRSRAAHRAAATVFAFVAFSAFAVDWKTAEPGWQYEFPRDHQAHREFKTEWWYFTGNLFDQQGRRFGYELTFFRHGVQPAAGRDPNASRFIVDDLKFAHFAFTDVTGQKFRFEQKTSRGAFGEAGFDDGNRVAWIENWTLTRGADDSFELAAEGAPGTLRFHLRASKGPVVHGQDGISRKAAAAGEASHYYSLPRLETNGELIVEGKSHAVRGESWFDHEWSTTDLGPDQIGWNWLSVQFADGSELMLYQMRLKNGGIDPVSSGTYVATDGAVKFLPSSAFRLTPGRHWRSAASGADYPVEWRVEIPEEKLSFSVRPILDEQEL